MFHKKQRNQVGTVLLSGIILTQSFSKALKGTTNLKQYFLCGHKIFRTNFQNSSCCLTKFWPTLFHFATYS